MFRDTDQDFLVSWGPKWVNLGKSSLKKEYNIVNTELVTKVDGGSTAASQFLHWKD